MTIHCKWCMAKAEERAKLNGKDLQWVYEDIRDDPFSGCPHRLNAARNMPRRIHPQKQGPKKNEPAATDRT